MIKTLNIKSRKNCIDYLFKLKNRRKNVPIDIRIKNTNLIQLNDLLNKKIFRKNDLFVNSDTLWQIMQPKGKTRSHNPHNLSPEEIIDALSSMNNLFAMFKSNNRYGLLTSIIAKNGQPILLVIEIGAGLIGDLNANINKFVTMYQIKDLKQKLNSINKDDFLYLNNSLKSIINKKPLN